MDTESDPNVNEVIDNDNKQINNALLGHSYAEDPNRNCLNIISLNVCGLLSKIDIPRTSVQHWSDKRTI